MRFGVREVADVTFYNIKTGEPELYLDTLKMSTLEQNSEIVYATGGKGNPRLLAFESNRTAQFNVQDALISMKSLAMYSGKPLVENGTEILHKREIAPVSVVDEAASITLKNEPIDDKSIFVYAIDENGLQGEKIDVIEIDEINNKKVEIDDTDVVDGQEVVVYYQYEGSDTQTVTISSDTFPAYYKIVGDTNLVNEYTGEEEPFQIYIPKAKMLAAHTITLQPDGDPSVWDFSLEVFVDSKTKELIKFIKY